MLNTNASEKFTKEGLTFDDVLLVPARSEMVPADVDISTELVRGIRLNSPFLTAAMDTVTTSKMAIAIAREGGIGIIHKNMSIERQQPDRMKQFRAAGRRDRHRQAFGKRRHRQPVLPFARAFRL